MNVKGEDFPELSQCAISHPYERRAVVLLYKAGWSLGELSLTFQIDEHGIRRLIKSEVDTDEY